MAHARKAVKRLGGCHRASCARRASHTVGCLHRAKCTERALRPHCTVRLSTSVLPARKTVSRSILNALTACRRASLVGTYSIASRLCWGGRCSRCVDCGRRTHWSWSRCDGCRRWARCWDQCCVGYRHWARGWRKGCRHRYWHGHRHRNRHRHLALRLLQ